MAIAPTGEGLAFGDAEGFIHLWSAQSDAKFCRFEGEVEVPDPVDPPERVNWIDSTPLNSIGMPHYHQPLLSLLPPTFDYVPSPAHHARAVLDPAILATVKTVDFVGYAPYPSALKSAGRRNQVTAGPGAKGAKRRVDVPMFRSEQERKDAKKKRDRIVSVSLHAIIFRKGNKD